MNGMNKAEKSDWIINWRQLIEWRINSSLNEWRNDFIINYVCFPAQFNLISGLNQKTETEFNAAWIKLKFVWAGIK